MKMLVVLHTQGKNHGYALFNMITNPKMSDMETCYKVCRREVIQSTPLEESRFGFETEVTVKIARRNLRAYEVAISYWCHLRGRQGNRLQGRLSSSVVHGEIRNQQTKDSRDRCNSVIPVARSADNNSASSTENVHGTFRAAD